ncbi:hypothetical protein B0T26DRAFT_751302 [Lasiosphaeria miniovina]|uniref:Uncharacterized protein n=1 Tax=Lasiosphaeria miniovina TaxID=1954250 RepID=A0AA40AK21_9PEZI|nr:uncharacterized protein B0T26DRAFT_751302 [Lasiosphaeria miniovina]KAK0717222.1 hypothetical protein B0T26DRAFT_751302 [Lasiosphaeria miniovina]
MPYGYPAGQFGPQGQQPPQWPQNGATGPGGPIPGQQMMYQRPDPAIEPASATQTSHSGSLHAPSPAPQAQAQSQTQPPVQAAPPSLTSAFSPQQAQAPPRQQPANEQVFVRAPSSADRLPQQAQPPLAPTNFGASENLPKSSGPALTLQATQGAYSVSRSPGHSAQSSVSGSRPEPARLTTTLSQDRNISPTPQLRYPGQPPADFGSARNPAISNPPSPSQTRGLGPGQQQGQLQSNLGLVPQRQPSAVSQISTQPGGASPPQGSEVVASPISHASLTGQSPITAPSPHVTPERTVSPEPPAQQQAGPKPSILVQDYRRAVSPEPPSQLLAPPNSGLEQRLLQRVDEDNIYDATPRHSVQPPLPLQQLRRDDIPSQINSFGRRAPPGSTAEPKTAGLSHDVVGARSSRETNNHKPSENIIISAADDAAARPPISPASSGPQDNDRETAFARGGENGIIMPSSSSREAEQQQQQQQQQPPQKSTLVDFVEEAKRKALLREQEEKIPVFPTEPDMDFAAAAAAKKKEQEELPQMTATSYPGQEWNPYGDGLEEWE